MKVLENNQLGQLYFGKKVNPRDSLAYLFELHYRPMTSYVNEDDLLFSLEK